MQLPWPPPYCSKADLLPLIDKDADHLPGLKTSLMNRAGRLIYGLDGADSHSCLYYERS
jgi:hypothetical protein